METSRPPIRKCADNAGAILLPFHEAGHYAIFRWFGDFIQILGGSLAQLLMPAILAGALLVRR